MMFDLIVVGGGPGGYTGALEAAALKKKVLLIEEDALGGTCLNRGGIPTKALLRAAGIYREMVHAADLGLACTEPSYDLAAMSERGAAVQTNLRDGIAAMMKRGGVTVVNARGRILDGHHVEADGEVYEGANVLAAAGSVPSLPPIPGLDLDGIVTSDDLLDGKGVDCKSLVIIGGGVIGVEFAQIYSSLGAKVTIIEALPRLLANLDRELGQGLAMSLKKRGVEIFTSAAVTAVTACEGGLACTFSDKKGEHSAEGEKVLVCTGRKANTADLFSEETAAALGLVKGFVPADALGKTCVDGLWAAGDLVLGGIQLAHAAEAAARNAVAAMFGEPAVKDASYIPSCIFTDPEIACVGLSLDEAKAAGIPAAAKKNLSTSNGKALIEGADRGFAKLVYNTETGAVLGAQLMFPHAAEMVGGLTAAIRSGLTVDGLAATVFPHPTVSEVLGL